jgi:phospholipase/carboxylesterase
VTANPHLAAQPLLRGAPIESATAGAVIAHGRRGVASLVDGTAFETPDVLDPMFELQRCLALPDAAYVLPVAEDGSWYPARYTDPLEANEPHLTYALEAYDAAVARFADAGRPPERLALVGFSQGACLTLQYVAGHPRRYGAVAALTGSLIGPDGKLAGPDPSHGLDGTPLLITTKEHDAWVSAQRTRASAAVLADAGARVDLRIFAGTEHSITDEEVAAVRELIRRASNEKGGTAMSSREDMFADIDRMDAGAWAGYLSEDVTFRFGNEQPLLGREAARDALAAFYDTIDGVSHEFREAWEVEGTTIVESNVTYTRKDGNAVTVPIVTIYRLADDGLIGDYRIYADVAPVFA